MMSLEVADVPEEVELPAEPELPDRLLEDPLPEPS